jgi:uncharacterized iron-regulated membrane protein
VRRTLFQLHLIAAALAGVFIVVLGLTGSVMAFEDELDHLTHPRLFRVAPHGTTVPLRDLSARAAALHPGKPVVGYGFGVSPDLAWWVSVGGAQVFVNQYTGEVLGERSGPTWLSQIHQLHLRLLAGETGRTIVAWAGVVLVFLTLSGLYLWWPIKRIGINAAAGGRRVWFDIHNAVGILSLVFLFLLALTGSVIGFERLTTPWLYRVTGSAPMSSNVAIVPRPDIVRVTPEDAVGIARAALPGAVPIGVNVPGPKAAYRVALRYPEDRTPGGRSRVYVDPYGGAVVQAESSRTTAAGTRLINLNRALHTGDVFGVASKTVMSLVSLAVVLQAVTGLMMWIRRKRR